MNLKKLQETVNFMAHTFQALTGILQPPNVVWALQRTKYLLPLPESNLYSSAVQSTPYTD